MADLISMLAASAGNQGNAWDLDFATFEGILYGRTFASVFGTGGTIGLTFSSDGTKMYVTGTNRDAIDQFDLSTAYRPSTMPSAVTKTFSVAGQEAAPQDVRFNSDGTKMYVLGGFTNDAIYQYSLSTAWDVSTATYDNILYNVNPEESLPLGLEWKPDGTKFYVIGSSGDDVNEYDLSVAWDLSTVTFVQSFSVSAQTGAVPGKIRFKPDGTKMYVNSNTNTSIYEYVLSTPWDVSTASYNSVSYDYKPATNLAGATGLAFNDTGTELFAIIESSRTFGFKLSTAWDLSTVNSYYRNVGPQEATPRSVTFKPDGTVMYVLGASGDDVNEYSVSDAWQVQDASFVQVFLVSTQTGTTPVKVQFKNDGTKMYVLSNTNDAIYQYSLSTAWNVSTATYDSVSFSVTSQETQPQGMFFDSSGTRLYVVGTTSDTVFQYTLSSAWDLSTASYASKSFSVASQENTPHAVFIGKNGTVMYIVGITNDTIYQYTLSTPWDVSTATYANKSFSVSAYETTPNGLWFKDDGLGFYVIGETNDTVWQFTIS